jgi:hypothetical protein
MEALRIAFDAVVVGALALPWVALCLYLFTGDAGVTEAWDLVSKYLPQIPPALSAVLLFVAAYLLGSAVSRASGDFFNDQDLRIPITENSIRASVYASEPRVALVAAQRSPQSLSDDPQNVALLFPVQEAALLLQGTDRTERLSQLHAQILVLRGGAFDGFILCAFFLFGWCANRGIRPIRWTLIIPLLLLAAGVISAASHWRLHKTDLDDPPFMEFTFFSLGVAGLWLVGLCTVARRSYGRYFWLAGLLTVITYFGWWWSEVLYDRQVLHMFAVLNN